jgi:hypothetical protein
MGDQTEAFPNAVAVVKATFTLMSFGSPLPELADAEPLPHAVAEAATTIPEATVHLRLRLRNDRPSLALIPNLSLWRT